MSLPTFDANNPFGETVTLTPPLHRCYTHDGAQAVAKEWLRKLYGDPLKLEWPERRRFYELTGILSEFLDVLHPPELSYPPAK